MRRTEPGEWQEEKNPWGGVRRYRMNGNIKEYEMLVNVAGGIQVPESELEAYNKYCAENKEKELVRSRREAVSNEMKICPFKRARNGLDYRCTTDCAFYDDGCLFAGGTAAKETKDEYCPICTKCYEQCAVYRGGCTLINKLKSIKGE